MVCEAGMKVKEQHYPINAEVNVYAEPPLGAREYAFFK